MTPKRARTALHEAEEHASKPRGLGGVAHASTAAGVRRGRVGLAGEPVGRLKRATKEKQAGETLLTT
jgi:hypothetical protein